MTTPSTLEVPVRTATAFFEAATTEKGFLGGAAATSEGAEKRWLRERAREEEERVSGGLGLENRRGCDEANTTALAAMAATIAVCIVYYCWCFKNEIM